MFRKSAVAAALFFISISPDTYALGLGEIDMQSALNQPMAAVINLTSTTGADLSQIKISLASREAHQRAGLSRARILSDFRFNIETGSNGQPVVRVTSFDAIHEPYIEFLLQLEWPKGRLLRQYTVLVDPPVTIPAAPAVPAAPVASAPAPVTYESPRAVAARRAPADQPLSSPARSAPVPAAAPAADSYGPIRRSDTLWTIARQLRPDNSITMDQMMLALQRANPRAFMNNNINHMKAGVTLKVPDRSEIVSMTPREATAETRRQYAEWKAAREPQVAEETVDESTAEEPVTTGTAESAPAADMPVTTEARLQLMAPEDIAVEGAATAGDPGTAATDTDATETLSQQLALVSEEAEANRAQAGELQSRVDELEQQIATMNRLLELKNDELASMQQMAGNEPAVTAPAVETEPEAEPEPVATAAVDSSTADEEPRGIVNRLMDNPVLAGLGVLVALVLGGILWASTRQKNNQGMFDEEMTFDDQLAQAGDTEKPAPVPVATDTEERHEPAPPFLGNRREDAAGDPLTEADVYLAYGRIQQAEDVLQAALQTKPEDNAMRGKLLEVYHQAGNATAFDSLASDYHNSVSEDDSEWLKIAAMGYELSPTNELYQSAGGDKSGADFDLDLSGMEDLLEDTGLADNEPGEEALLEDIGLADNEPGKEALLEDIGLADNEPGLEALVEAADLADIESEMETLVEGAGSADKESGMEALLEGADSAEKEPDMEALLEDAGGVENERPETIEFNLEDPEIEAISFEQEDDESEGLLDSADEVTTKLDLARAYIDMGDPEGARSILDEVMEEGSDEQKREADTIISQLA